jgi:predicted transcriptional regulator
MRKPSPTLTPSELELMKLVWSRGQATVRDVYEALREERRVAYTTVMTTMNVLEKKGHLKRRPRAARSCTVPRARSAR